MKTLYFRKEEAFYMWRILSMYKMLPLVVLCENKVIGEDNLISELGKVLKEKRQKEKEVVR